MGTGTSTICSSWDVHVLLLHHRDGDINVKFHVGMHSALLLHDLRHVYDLLHDHGHKHVH